MTEPASGSAIIIALGTTGITILGVATGLHPTYLVAGFFGGLWSLSYHHPAGLFSRIVFLAISSMVAGYISPAASAVAAGAAAGLLPWWPQDVTRDVLQFPIAFMVGFLAMRWIGPALLRQAQKMETKT